MIILIIFCITFFVSCFFIGRKVAKNLDSYRTNPPTWAKILLLAYIVFVSCFAFPISSEYFPLEFQKVYLFVLSYGMIGGGFVVLYSRAKEKFVYLITLAFTILGMVFRYILEYGEVSNTYNFTVVNVITYIVIIPIFTVIAYHYVGRYLSKKI